jgi:8-oxo-dGTP pyrophosphatase MutT (NUDIX family)
MIPSDALATRFPVSIKGVLEGGGRVVLLRNERDEWELPGGKLEPGEDPKECVERELFEELNVRTTATRLLDVWLYDILGQVEVLIVTYAMQPLGADTVLHISDEHRELGLFPPEEIAALRMPEGYKRSIAAYYEVGED